MKDGVNATPLPTVNTTGYIHNAAFFGTINPDTNKVPKHLVQGYLNIYNNYFKAPWMPNGTDFFFFQAEDGIRDVAVTGVQTCALPIFEPLDHGRRPAEERVGAVAVADHQEPLAGPGLLERGGEQERRERRAGAANLAEQRVDRKSVV